MSHYRILNYASLISILFYVTGCFGRVKEEKTTIVEKNSEVTKASDSTVLFSKFHLALDIPFNWKSDQLNEGMFVFKMNCDTGRVFCPNLVARFSPMEQQLTLDDCASLFLSSFQEKFKNFRLVSSLDNETGKFKIRVVDYMFFENGTNLGGTTAFIIMEDGYLLTLSIMAENDVNGGYVIYRRLFENILNSIKRI